MKIDFLFIALICLENHDYNDQIFDIVERILIQYTEMTEAFMHILYDMKCQADYCFCGFCGYATNGLNFGNFLFKPFVPRHIVK